ncbi:hypothetical protein [Ligilactobacillus salivarius]|jgi:hypothetical protein|uniref:hypothetical protein n=2 Tax=Ligilactobacillus salivarius TaxID=1624 RepID=UPI001CDAA4BA|nr:hypothetical protein [Ligilactobacillus salivarius]
MNNELYKLIYSIITILITSGCFGYINYNILEKLNVVVDRPNKEIDKKQKIMIFTGINISLYWILTTVLNYEIALSIVLVLLFDVVGTILIIAPLAKGIDYVINIIRRIFGQSYAENRETRDYIFNTNKIQTLFVFDFDNNLITCGYLDYQQSGDNNYFDLALIPLDAPENQYSFEQVVEETSKHKDSRILVDFEKKIKIYILRY